MTNHFAFGAMKRPEGWIAFYRMVRHAENFVLRDGRHDILFPTKQAAKAAAEQAFMAALNSPISGLIAPDNDEWGKANAVFSLPETKRPSTIRQHKGKRLTLVERKGAKA